MFRIFGFINKFLRLREGVGVELAVPPSPRLRRKMAVKNCRFILRIPAITVAHPGSFLESHPGRVLKDFQK